MTPVDPFGSERTDPMVPESAARLGSAIGEERRLAVGDELPLLWHWVYFADPAPPGGLGADGHPIRQDPFVERYPRRMAGGGSVESVRPFRLGVPAIRRSRLEEVIERDGRSGPLAVVRVAHTYLQGDQQVRRETQTILYRAQAGPPDRGSRPSPSARGDADGLSKPPAAAGTRRTFSPVDLFRFSAATWNAHRIHYDRDYATGPEGYQGLLVHGPLLALLLVQELERVGDPVGTVEYRAIAPVFDVDVVEFRVTEGDGLRQAEVVKGDGTVAMVLNAGLLGGAARTVSPSREDA